MDTTYAVVGKSPPDDLAAASPGVDKVQLYLKGPRASVVPIVIWTNFWKI